MLRYISSFLNRYGFLCIALLFVASGAWALGETMRESDQASILTGALDIAWGGNLFQNDAYRYDKFYGTYWILAAFYKAVGVGIGADPYSVVKMGNALALCCLSISLICLALKRKATVTMCMVFFVSLFAPVLLLSSSLVSPNIFSVAFILLLICLMGKPYTWLRGGGIVLATYAAVACRQDAVLILPLLCLLSEKRFPLFLWKFPRCLCAFLGSVFALLVSRFIAGNHTSGIGEAFFFDIKIGLAYTVFGVGFGLILIVLFSFFLLKKCRWSACALLVALLLPLLFYLPLLFSPRHLMLVPVALLATVCLPRGRVYWKKIESYRWGRRAVLAVFIVALSSMFIGLRFPSVSGPKLSMKYQTLYPTADGYWPMGGYFSFLSELRQAKNLPIDHNQEVFHSWTQYDFQGNEIFYFHRLYRYPEFVAKLQGDEPEFSQELKSSSIVSERSYRKEAHLWSHGDSFEVTAVPGIWREEVKFAFNRETQARLIAARMMRGNDFIFMHVKDLDKIVKLPRYEGHLSYVISLKPLVSEADEQKVNDFFVYKKVWGTDIKMEDTFVAIMRLPMYMKVSESRGGE